MTEEKRYGMKETTKMLEDIEYYKRKIESFKCEIKSVVECARKEVSSMFRIITRLDCENRELKAELKELKAELKELKAELKELKRDSD